MKNFKLTVIAIFILLFCFKETKAQFNTIVPYLPTKEAIVFAKDGTQTKGKVITSIIIGGMLKSFTIKDEAGTKHKFKASDVIEVRAKLTGLAKLIAVSEANDNVKGGKIAQVKAIVNATQDEIWKKDLVIFYQVEIKPGKFSLLQLLNPGTNTIISVYPAPNTQDNGEQYYFAVKGDQITKVVKKGYGKDTYANLFSDCDTYYKNNPADKKLKIKDFGFHLSNYHEACK